MKNLFLVSSLLLTTSLLAATNIPAEEQNLTLEVEEVSSHQLVNMGMGFSTSQKSSSVQVQDFGGPGGFAGGRGAPTRGITGGGKPGGSPDPEEEEDTDYSGGGSTGTTLDDRIAQTGQIIQVARDIVGLGEAMYELVSRGKPQNNTEYEPISVVPRDPTSKEPVDPFDLEGFSFPVERNYVAKIKNAVGKVVVAFSYKLMYSYGGSYNGAGKYLTNVIIIPGAVKTAWGWEFNATMKLSGIMNHGTRANPVAGVMVTMKYQMNGWKTAYERNDTIHITGLGQMKHYTSKY